MSMMDFWSNLVDGISDAANWVGDTFFGGSHSTNQANMAMNNQNIAFQMHENEIARLREDNAHQRAAADLEAAGLSKTLAAGNPASAQAMTAPSNTNQMQRNLAGQNALSALKDFYFDKRADSRAEDLNKAQIAKLDAETTSQNISNKYAEDVYKTDLVYKTAQTAVSQATVESIEIQNEINRIAKEFKIPELQANIDAKLAEAQKDIAQADYSKKSIELLAEQITSEILKQDQVKALTALDRQQLDNLVRDYTYKYYQIESLKHDLNYSQMVGLPVGSMPNGTIGSFLNSGTALFNMFKDLLNGRSHNTVLTPSFGFDGSFNGYTSVMENSGGGHVF